MLRLAKPLGAVLRLPPLTCTLPFLPPVVKHAHSRTQQIISRTHNTRFLHTSTTSTTNTPVEDGFELILHRDVQDALHTGKPVVALESTIITHGMPYPANKETALAVEKVVRDAGAVPATIAILEGRVHVGCTQEEVDFLATTGKKARKTSRRDLALVVATKGTGATTVSGTMLIAHKCGIRVFVTGGIGGVHRGGEITMDVSADLTELGRTPVAVVSAGIKSILDIPRTLEYLETQGVTTITFGPTRDFPAFFCRRTGGDTVAQAMANMSSPQQVAQLILANSRLDLNSGMVIAVPIPEQYAKDPDHYEAVVEGAVAEARGKHITGADVTPFLLQRVNELTGGESLEANIALIKNNARAGAEIAVELARLEQMYPPRQYGRGAAPSVQKRWFHTHIHTHHYRTSQGFFPFRFAFPFRSMSTVSGGSLAAGHAVVVGGALVDVIAKCHQSELGLVPHTSNPGTIRESFGGVGRNIAEGLTRLGHTPLFLTAIGNDIRGRSIREHSASYGLPFAGVLVSEKSSTASYAAVLTADGQLEVAITDTHVLKELTPATVTQHKSAISNSKMVVLDGNINGDTLEYLCTLCKRSNIPVWYEPTSVPKAVLPITAAGIHTLSALTYISPNEKELRAMAEAAQNACAEGAGMPDVGPELRQRTVALKKITQAYPLLKEHQAVVRDSFVMLEHGVRNIVATLGAKGTLCIWTASAPSSQTQTRAKVFATLVDTCPVDEIADVTGAGDSLVSGVIAGVLEGRAMEESLCLGMFAAHMSVQSYTPISTHLGREACTRERVAEMFRVSKTIDLSEFVEVEIK